MPRRYRRTSRKVKATIAAAVIGCIAFVLTETLPSEPAALVNPPEAARFVFYFCLFTLFFAVVRALGWLIDFLIWR